MGLPASLRRGDRQGRQGRAARRPAAGAAGDEQAGTLKDDRDPTDQAARRTEALLAHLAKTFPGKADWATFRKRIEPLLAEAKAGAPDLTERRWHMAWHSPAIADPSAVERHLRSGVFFNQDGGTPETAWRHPFLGNSRTLGLAVDGAGRVVCVGWSPTRTSGEPWWSPFVVRFDAQGRELGRWFSPDPFAGKDERMGGLVSDAAVFAVAPSGPEGLVLSLAGDGGNNVLLLRDPRDWSRPSGLRWHGQLGSTTGRRLFWGGLGRLDGDGALVAAAHLGRPQPDEQFHGRLKGRGVNQECFATALAAAGGGATLALGCYRGVMPTVGEGWNTPPPKGAYGNFFAVFAPDLTTCFCTAIDPFEAVALAARGERVLLGGSAGRQALVMALDLRVGSQPPARPGP